MSLPQDESITVAVAMLSVNIEQDSGIFTVEFAEN